MKSVVGAGSRLLLLLTLLFVGISLFGQAPDNSKVNRGDRDKTTVTPKQ
jgi:hypothetical protein